MIHFESTTSLLRKLTGDFLFFSCVIKDTLINFLGVILIENAPKRRILSSGKTLWARGLYFRIKLLIDPLIKLRDIISIDKCCEINVLNDY